MASGESGKFKVDRLPHVSRQIRQLGEKAKAYGVLTEFLNVLKENLGILGDEPLKWGDPEYHPIAKGSTVCHGVLDPLLVQFAVFELEHKVMIMQVKVIPNSILD